MTNHLRSVSDDAAFEAWYVEHARRLRLLCLKMLKDDGLADDVVQETLLRAWSRREQFAAGADIGPWLRTVARNLCIEHLRSRSRLVPASDSLPDRPDDEPDAQWRLERSEEHRAVRDALETLSERHRSLLLAHDVDGVGYAEIAGREGLNENAARAVLFRARRVLKERVAAATRAVGGLIVAMRLRARHASGRSAPLLQTPAAAAFMHGIAGVAVVVAATTSVASPAPSELRPNAAASISAAAERFGAEAMSGGSEGSAPKRRSGGSPASVAATVDRRSGEVAAKAGVRNPVTGDEEHVWTRVWRENGGGEDGSVVLGAADEGAATACETSTETCETVDDLLDQTGSAP